MSTVGWGARAEVCITSNTSEELVLPSFQWIATLHQGKVLFAFFAICLYIDQYIKKVEQEHYYSWYADLNSSDEPPPTQWRTPMNVLFGEFPVRHALALLTVGGSNGGLLFSRRQQSQIIRATTADRVKPLLSTSQALKGTNCASIHFFVKYPEYIESNSLDYHVKDEHYQAKLFRRLPKNVHVIAAWESKSKQVGRVALNNNHVGILIVVCAIMLQWKR